MMIRNKESTMAVLDLPHEVKGLCNSIVSVCIDSLNDKKPLTLIQEELLALVLLIVREADKIKVG